VRHWGVFAANGVSFGPNHSVWRREECGGNSRRVEFPNSHYGDKLKFGPILCGGVPLQSAPQGADTDLIVRLGTEGSLW